MKTYYEVLQVAETASAHVIRAAWITLQREYHTDRPIVGMTAVQQKSVCQFINEAYQVLGDADRRAAYDAELKRKRKPVEMPNMGFDPTAYPDAYSNPLQFGQDLLTNAAMLAGAAFAKHVMEGVPTEFRTVVENALKKGRKAG